MNPPPESKGSRFWPRLYLASHPCTREHPVANPPRATRYTDFYTRIACATGDIGCYYPVYHRMTSPGYNKRHRNEPRFIELLTVLTLYKKDMYSKPLLQRIPVIHGSICETPIVQSWFSIPVYKHLICNDMKIIENISWFITCNRGLNHRYSTNNTKTRSRYFLSIDVGSMLLHPIDRELCGNYPKGSILRIISLFYLQGIYPMV
jgi:hypothetical protein